MEAEPLAPVPCVPRPGMRSSRRNEIASGPERGRRSRWGVRGVRDGAFAAVAMER